jgi:mannose-6-phosphate isomerase
LWGGRRLAEILHKPIGDESCAESWEIVDHNLDQSVIKYGDLAGTTLHWLIEQFGSELLGETVFQRISVPELPVQLQRRFPLLLKFLDAQDRLSVQVHPNDRLAATLDPPDLGKTEAWYVLHAHPSSRIYAGLKNGVTREMFIKAVQENRTEDMLHSFQPHAGDCVLIQAGTVHAIGEGCLIAEIQQASDTTFRIFDWNRLGPDGQSRQLHIEQGINATDFRCGPASPLSPMTTEFREANTIVSCDQFTMRGWEFSHPVKIGGDGKFHILAVIRGEVDLSNDPSDQPLSIGGTALIPAALDAITISPRQPAHLLDIFVPG